MRTTRRSPALRVNFRRCGLRAIATIPHRPLLHHTLGGAGPCPAICDTNLHWEVYMAAKKSIKKDPVTKKKTTIPETSPPEPQPVSPPAIADEPEQSDEGLFP